MNRRWGFVAASLIVLAHTTGCSSQPETNEITNDAGADADVFIADTALSSPDTQAEIATDSGATADTATSDTMSDTLGDAISDTAPSETATCPPNETPAGCPAHFADMHMNPVCAHAGLTCRYYGEGDEPCPSYGECTCVAVDGGTPTWGHCVQ